MSVPPSAQSAAIIAPGSGIVGVSTVVYPEGATPAVTVGYWSIRGLAQAIRYVLAYANVPFADTRYQQGGAPDLSRSAWLDVKEKLDLDFPNLPYYIEPATAAAASPAGKDLRLTQSTTILRHLGRKHGLAGQTLEEQARCDLVLDTTYDFKSVLVSTAYSRPASRADAFAEFGCKTVPHYFSQFESLLSRSGTSWFAGSNLTIADFILFEMIDQTRLMLPGVLEGQGQGVAGNGAGYPLLKAFTERFLALPQVIAYRKSTHFMERPLNNMAGFQ